MIPLIYGAIYKTPDDYKPPEETNLTDNTNYPNLNSRDYAKRPLNNNVRMHEAWECVSISTKDTDEKGNVAIATNKLSGRNWIGTLWAFEKGDVKKDVTAIKSSNSCYKLECPSIINCMEFVEPSVLLLAYNSGKLQVWSTQSEVRCPKNPYCPFLIGEKCEHIKPITCLTGFKTNEYKAITGCKNGSLKIWDMGKADLFSIHSFPYAHMDVINGLASSPVNDNVFLTCSLDKSCLLWDVRETIPTIAMYSAHNVRFKTVCWPGHSLGNSIYLGDESGNVLMLDIRKPNVIINKTKYFDRPIKKLSQNGENLAVISDSNIVQISKISTHEQFYKNDNSQNFIRDCAWITPTDLLTVGLEGKMRVHHIKKSI